MDELTLMMALDSTLIAILKTICIITIPVLITGVIVSILQAATQINEMTVTFIPKLLVMFLVLLSFLPWLFDNLTILATDFMHNIPGYLR